MVEVSTKSVARRARIGDRKLGRLCVAVALAGVLQVTGLPGLGEGGLLGSDNAYAQRAQREKPKTKASSSVSDAVNKELLKVTELLDQGQEAEAIAVLQRLLQRELKPFERAVVLRMMGGIYANMGNYPRAIQAFESAERLNAFDEAQQADLLFFLGQLYLAEDRVDDAIRALETWFSTQGESAGAQAYFTLAQAYAIKENYRRALQLAEQGLAKAREAGDLRENWFKFTVAMYYQNTQIKNMQNLLREMVGLFPGRPAYWSQLSSTYAILEDETTAYYIRVMMDVQDMFIRSSEYSQLAQIHVYNEVPIRGAELMQRGFSRNKIDEEFKNYETLAMALQEAREWKDSIQPLRRAAELSPDGDLYIRLCQSYLVDRQYKQAEDACLKGINKRGLTDAGTAWMLLGTSRYQQGNLSGARTAFNRATNFERSETNARRWIRFIDQEIAREKRKAAEEAAEAAAEAGDGA